MGNDQSLPQAEQFHKWLGSHPCSKTTLWYIQNCIGDVWGQDHPVFKAAIEAWSSTPKDE